MSINSIFYKQIFQHCISYLTHIYSQVPRSSQHILSSHHSDLTPKFCSLCWGPVVLPCQDTQVSGMGGVPALCATCPNGSGTGIDPVRLLQASREHSWDKGTLKSRQDLGWVQSSSNTAYPAGFPSNSYRAPCQGQDHKDTIKISMGKYEAL